MVIEKGIVKAVPFFYEKAWKTKIKYNESIIRHLFLVVKEHNGEDSSLFVESKNKKPEPSEVEKDKEDVKKDPEPVKEDVEDKSEAKQEEGEDNE